MIIRKVTIGPDYKSGMNFVIGGPVGGGNTIHAIKRLSDGSVEVYVINEVGEVRFWKMFNHTVPIHLEFDLSF